MLRDRAIVISYCVVAALAVLTFFNVDHTFELEVVDDYSVTYSPNVAGVSIYEPGEYDNVMKCNLTTVNNIIYNMISEDYFYIESDKSEGHILDVVLSNDVEEYRILYNRRTRDYMCLSDPFLKNYVPVTYIRG